MPVQLSVEDLIEYTDWERRKWGEFLGMRGDEVLKIAVGPEWRRPISINR